MSEEEVYEKKSILVGIFEVKWTGKGLTFSTLNETYELDADESYSLFVWLHDDLGQALYRAVHPAQGKTDEDVRDELARWLRNERGTDEQ
jgi:hypothetical protein